MAMYHEKDHLNPEESMKDLETRIRQAWQGRISGCQLGKPVELLSMREGYDALKDYLVSVDAWPPRDYIGYREAKNINRDWCRESITRSEPDDDINYSFLALLMLEEYGKQLSTADVARTWLRLLPAGVTYTAERAAYRILMTRGNEWFAESAEPGFDLAECADNPYNDWIGAQIRADVYGWVCPGEPEFAADLAGRDAALSHKGEGIHGAVFVAALGAALADSTPDEALVRALKQIPANSEATIAVNLGMELAGDEDGGARIRKQYEGMSPVHTLNNLAIVTWALYSHLDDFSAAIGDAVAAGLDTDCNGATVGALWALQGDEIPEHWTRPWQNRVGLGLAGYSEVSLDELVERTVTVAKEFTQQP
jgi:ADP-ribosylglycohydrolase